MGAGRFGCAYYLRAVATWLIGARLVVLPAPYAGGSTKEKESTP